MPYCTVDDVQSLIPPAIWNHDAVGADPTAAQLLTWITEVDAEINGALAARYTIPITGSEALGIVQSISMRLVATRVWGKVYTAQAGDASIPEDWRQARKLLERLAAGDVILRDAASLGLPSASAPGAPDSSFRPLPDDPLADEPLAPIFSMQDIY